MTKLTDEELNALQALVGNYNNVKIKIADAVIAKEALLKEIHEMKSAYIIEEKKILAKYGEDSVINVKTGDIKYGNN
jgi:hypothetical protein